MRISVALCTYNGSQYIKQQLDSILNQTQLVDEIIVCDDISRDDTIKIIESYNLPEIKIYVNQKNLGSVKNFEKAIKLCSGDIIFLADQDDIWLHNKVEVLINYFKLNKNISVLATNGFCINEKNEVLEHYTVWDVPEFFREKNIPFQYFDLMNFTVNIATGASMAVRKNYIETILPIPTIKEMFHDEWFALNAAKINSFELLNDKLFSYRIHSNQQVGGVCFEKSELIKKKLVKFFNYNLQDESMNSYKRLVKKFYKKYKSKRLQYLKFNQENEFLRDNSEIILQKYFESVTNFKQKYPTFSRVIFFIDKILKKRQLNSIP